MFSGDDPRVVLDLEVGARISWVQVSQGFLCRDSKPLKTTKTSFLAKVQAQKVARETARKGKTRRRPMPDFRATFHGCLGRQETSQRCVTSKGDDGGGKPGC